MFVDRLKFTIFMEIRTKEKKTFSQESGAFLHISDWLIYSTLLNQQIVLIKYENQQVKIFCAFEILSYVLICLLISKLL